MFSDIPESFAFVPYFTPPLYFILYVRDKSMMYGFADWVFSFVCLIYRTDGANESRRCIAQHRRVHSAHEAGLVLRLYVQIEKPLLSAFLRFLAFIVLTLVYNSQIGIAFHLILAFRLVCPC